jgi:WD40 repeat protein
VTRYDLHALAFGPRRMLYGSTSSCALVSLALPSVGQLADVPLKLAEHTGAHRTVAEALHVSNNGKYVVSGGNDRIVKVWDGKQLTKPSTARGRKASADVQAFVGHSDHVTRVAFSADGTSLLTVGGGDAIFVWEFCGDVAADEAAC